MTPTLLLLLAAATVGIIHSVLPDHWAPIAVVARTQRWTLARTARVSALAAGGHVVASLLLGGVTALIGLQFQHQFENQQGHVVGGVLVVTGVGFLLWGLTGHGHAHELRWHGDAASSAGPHEHNEGEGDGHPHSEGADHAAHEHQTHQHEHSASPIAALQGAHAHEHVHAGRRHSHRHNHEAFIHQRADLMARKSAERTLVGSLAAIVVPFGVAASPDLTFLPVAVAASAYGSTVVVATLAVFATVTMASFVALTVVATAAGYQMKGEWLENHANTVTSVFLIAVGVVVYLGL
jgi:nickel/cobalt exporter